MTTLATQLQRYLTLTQQARQPPRSARSGLPPDWEAKRTWCEPNWLPTTVG